MHVSLAFALAVGTQVAVAQTGTILGTVLDSAGVHGPLEPTVKAFDEDKQIVARETTTSTEGTFQLTPLLPGRYTVPGNRRGFQRGSE